MRLRLAISPAWLSGLVQGLLFGVGMAVFMRLQRRLDYMLRTRRYSVIIFSAMLVLYVALAVTQSRWWLVAALGAAALVTMTVVSPVRARRRLDVLSPPAER